MFKIVKIKPLIIFFLIISFVIACSTKSKIVQPKLDEKLCSEKFFEALESMSKQEFYGGVKRKAFGRFLIDDKPQSLRGMNYNCFLSIGRDKSDVITFDYFIDTIPQGNVRKVLSANTELVSCENEKFYLKDIDREEILILEVQKKFISLQSSYLKNNKVSVKYTCKIDRN